MPLSLQSCRAMKRTHEYAGLTEPIEFQESLNKKLTPTESDIRAKKLKLTPVSLNNNDKSNIDDSSVNLVSLRQKHGARVGIQKKQWQNVDMTKIKCTEMINEYSDDIFSYLYQLEDSTSMWDNYVADAKSEYYIRPAMRAILVDWLVEVHSKFKYQTETLLLAINLMDKFLSQNKVTVNKLQLLAITSLFIAAKFEEPRLPRIMDYAYLTDGAATTEDIRVAEMFMFQSLNYQITPASHVGFFERISTEDDDNSHIKQSGTFFIKYTTCCSKFIGLKPSLMSLISLYLARKIFSCNKDVWNSKAKKNSNIDIETNDSFRESCKELIRELVSPSTKLNALTSIFKTSSSDVYLKIQQWCEIQVTTNFNQLF